MKHPFRTLAWPALLGASLCVAMLLASCQPSGPQTPDESQTDAATEQTEMNCKVTVQNHNGENLTDVVVKVRQGDRDVTSKVIGPTGQIAFTLPAGTYSLSLESPSGAKFFYDADTAVLTPDAPEVTIKAYQGATESWKFNAPSKKVMVGYGEIEAPLAPEGTTCIELVSDDYTYVVFNPTRGGTFTFTASEGVDIAYHGIPILVYDDPRMKADENGVLTIPIEDTSIGSDSVSQLVFRLTPKEGYEADHAVITITRTGDIIKSPEEQAQWIIVEADKSALDALASFKEPAEGDKWHTLTTGKLTNLNIEDPNLTVVLGEDGYYHYGTADGPMVFVRMTSDSPYLEDFVKICETDNLRCFFYAEDGTFLRKESYSALVTAYGEVANADGVVPLNAQLATAIQNFGGYMGWWNYKGGNNIFGELMIDPSIAWLFACAIYQ